MQKVICQLDEIAEPGGHGFVYELSGHEYEGFIVRWQGEVRAFLNACPHTGVTLNWAEDQFFDLGEMHLQCSLHGALFNPLDGVCVYGPCHGQQLTPVAITISNGKVMLAEL